MNSQELQEINNTRESWCAVELSNRQSWCRTERKHNPDAFKSTAFSPNRNQETASRCTFEVNDRTHRERRHFPNKSSYSHLAI
ncbi:protein SPATA45 homolog [Anneissia japonica]|uniref:protein SPATA45 homolog n=1 Tax=Anneissia japonica TaxID=1529436 RepID=UPI001425915C|nr:protein SPATA45 homolog [Anneissia japonica]